MSGYYPNIHGLLDAYGCNQALLRNPKELETILRQAIKNVGAHVLSCYFHHFGGEGGVTGVLLLTESHISIHTWPEHCFAAVDIFLCGTSSPAQVAQYLEQALHAHTIEWREYSRGALLLKNDGSSGISKGRNNDCS